MIKVYGAQGCGSAITELMLTMAKVPYHYINVDEFDKPGSQRDVLSTINPLCQVPTLVLDDGSIMTESAAIALMLLEKNPELAPAVHTADYQQFLRLLIWIVANVYPTFTYADYPERWLPIAKKESQIELVNQIEQHRKSLYLWLESQLQSSLYTFGDQLTLIDAYWPIICRWYPNLPWFNQYTPKLRSIANRVSQQPEFIAIINKNFPS